MSMQNVAVRLIGHLGEASIRGGRRWSMRFG